jgi:hypothetical protein
MSNPLIRKLLETQLNTVTPAVPTAFENMPFTPTQRTPWQRVTMMPAATGNPTMGDSFKREQGVFQVSLFYPTNEGAHNAEARAELVKTAFNRGSTFVSANVSVKILEHPYASYAIPGDGWFHVPVTIPYVADVT